MVYKVTKVETESYYTLIDCNSEEEAREIATSKNVCWRNNQNLDSTIVEIELVGEEKDLIGIIIDTKEDYYQYIKK